MFPIILYNFIDNVRDRPKVVEICHPKVSQLGRNLLVIGTMPRSTISRVVLAPMAPAITITDLRAGPKAGKDQTVSGNKKVASILLYR